MKKSSLWSDENLDVNEAVWVAHIFNQDDNDCFFYTIKIVFLQTSMKA